MIPVLALALVAQPPPPPAWGDPTTGSRTPPVEVHAAAQGPPAIGPDPITIRLRPVPPATLPAPAVPAVGWHWVATPGGIVQVWGTRAGDRVYPAAAPAQYRPAVPAYGRAWMLPMEGGCVGGSCSIR